MPEKTPVDWFEEDSSRHYAAQLWFADGWVYVENDIGKRHHAAFSDVHISSRLANTPRQLNLPNGVNLTASDNDFIDRALAANNMHKTAGIVHHLERRWRWIAVLVAATAIAVYGGAVVGVPQLAKSAAARVPLPYIQEIEQTTYDNFVQSDFLHDSRLSDFQQQRVQKIFADVVANYPTTEYTMRLRMHWAGFDSETPSKRFGLANAFALPAGLIVVTDDLVLKLRNNEIAAVIAHELGHVHHQHGLRGLLQAAGIGAFFALALGDFSGTILIPAAFLQFKYSRDFEREADCHAYDYLKRRGLPTTLIGESLKKMEADWQRYEESKKAATPEAEKDNDYKNQGWEKFIQLLSTHPATDARLDLASSCAPAD